MSDRPTSEIVADLRLMQYPAPRVDTVREAADRLVELVEWATALVAEIDELKAKASP